MTLRLRLLLFVLFAMSPALLVIIDTAVDQRRHLVEDAEQGALQLAQLAVKNHESLISETRQLLDVLVKLPQLREKSASGCDALLSKLLVDNARYTNFGVIGLDGETLCSGSPLPGRVNLADRLYFREAVRTGGFAVGEYQVGRIVKQPVLAMAMPILNKAGQVQRVVFASLSLDWLSRFTPVAMLPAGSVVTVIDRNAVILTQIPDPQNRWRGVNAMSDGPFVEQFLASGRNEWITKGHGIDGVHRFYALARLGAAAQGSTSIMVGLPSGPLYAAVEAEFARNLGLLGLVLLIVVLLTWFGGEALIVKRMQLLAAAARRVGEGRLDTRVEIRGNDEIALVAAEFNRMADTLGTNHDQIRKLNRIHSVLSGINGAILRIRERDALLNEACRIAVERGELLFAWIGLRDPASGELDKAAWHGVGEDYLREICLPPHPEAERCCYPCTEAILRDRMVIYNDITQVSDDAVWQERALAQGYRSMVVLPLHIGSRVVGILNLYAGDTNVFDEQEIDLLLELAADISLGLEYIEKDSRIAHLVYHDAVTDLPNRRLCLEHLKQAIARARHRGRLVAMVVLNISGFHRLVGTHGHHIADRILKLVAQYLLSGVRDGDTVARLEGDEFGIVFADMASMDDVIHVSRALVDSIPAVLPCGDKEIALTVRAGVTVYPDDSHDPAELLRNANLASNSQKATSTRSVWFYSLAIHEAMQHQERMERALRHAIESGEGLALHYQPVVDIASFQVVSFEALARWNSQEFGNVPPAEFIPLAEESGLIVPLGNWVLTTACRQIEAWRAIGMAEARIAVNVSFRQWRDPDFIERIERIAGAVASQLAIELTESELMDGVETTIAGIARLKEHGIITYIDDFGTGYSSLSYLQRLPVQVLKIDQRFTRELGQSEESAAIVRAIIALAKSLKLKTIAEGVETTGQLAILRDMGCDYVQGFLISQPRPAAELLPIVEQGRMPPPGA